MPRTTSRHDSGGAGARRLTGDGSLAERLGLHVEDVAAFDDLGLETFLDPSDGGIDAAQLGLALSGCAPSLIDRIAHCLPVSAAGTFLHRAQAPVTQRTIEAARRHVLDQLVWPLVYWTRPDDYEELVRGERIPDRIIDELDIDGRVVCDIGAGSGRFTVAAAHRARRVCAVDVVPTLLGRLQRAADALHLDNIEVMRGAFRRLPLAERSVDVAVACSSFTTRGAHGGASALREAERLVRHGGSVAVIWPQQPDWYRRRGYEHIRVRGNTTHWFSSVDTAVRLCATYYSGAAADWARQHRSQSIPFSVLGVPPPNDVCIKRIQ